MLKLESLFVNRRNNKFGFESGRGGLEVECLTMFTQVDALLRRIESLSGLHQLLSSRNTMSLFPQQSTGHRL